MDILLDFVARGSQRLFSRTLVAALNTQQDRPWMQLRKGKEIDELWLARQLAPYGVRPRGLRVETAWGGQGLLGGGFRRSFPALHPAFGGGGTTIGGAASGSVPI